MNSSVGRERQPAFEIFYILALPDWAPHDVTPFAGFAPGLIDFIPLMDFIPRFPADILDPTIDLDDRLARRRAGSGAWLWTPVNLTTLIGKRKPVPSYPFMVVFSADEETAKAVSKWRNGLRLRPIHVSFQKGGGAIHPAHFTEEVLRQHLVQLARKAAEIDKRMEIGEHLKALRSWNPTARRPTSLHFHGHNVTHPNEMALIGAGEKPATSEEGHLQTSPHEDYVAGVTQSAEAVMALWPRTEDRFAYLITPPRPDLFLIAPSIYRGMTKKIERAIESPVLKAALRALDRQRGYTMQFAIETDEDGDLSREQLDLVGPMLGLRGAEMKLTTCAIGLRTAGTVAATIRLPPAINRTGGVIGQLGRFLRKHENPPPIKSTRVYKLVQDALRKEIPDEHLDVIAKSRTGIKIIADAPVEWLPVNGLPLGIRFDVSRINATPGNLFMQQIRPPVPLFMPPHTFRNYLVLSMFEDDDQIAPHLRTGALTAMDGDQKPIIGKFSSPKTPEEFIAAIASFDGPMLVIDSHAEHQEGDAPGGLIIGGKSFDVWSLAGKVQMPPIVILSACDTHPFDRSHATVANGFLACGAMAVVATALPIRAVQAARFIMRLLNRAVHFADIMNKSGRAVLWTNIVSGVLRMELVTDVIEAFAARGCYDDVAAKELLLETLKDLNPQKTDWYERFQERIFAACAMERAAWDQQLADAIAASDAIRYIHLGNPEGIIVAGPQVARQAFDLAGMARQEPDDEVPQLASA